MDDYRKDEIIYDENWQSVCEPIISQNTNDTDNYADDKRNEEESKVKKEKRVFPALISIQLVLCLIIAFSVFILKAMNSDSYKQLCSWYNDLMQETILPNSAFENIDLSQYFSATADEVSTNDEV